MEQKNVEIVEMSIQFDHVHVIAMIPPELSISDFYGVVNYKTAIRVFNRYKDLKKKPY